MRETLKTTQHLQKMVFIGQRNYNTEVALKTINFMEREKKKEVTTNLLELSLMDIRKKVNVNGLKAVMFIIIPALSTLTDFLMEKVNITAFRSTQRYTGSL